jgi:hypothetical protein
MKLVRPAGFEPALCGLSNRSLCLLGYGRVEDQVGLEPTKLLRIGLRGRSLCRSGHWSGGLAWLRSTCRRVKSPLPLHSGLGCESDDLVQAGGVEPPATRLSAGALTVRTGLR